MNQQITHIAHLPIAYQCAIEMLGATGERTEERHAALCEHYASTYGLTTSEHHAQWRHDAWCIARRRYLID